MNPALQLPTEHVPEEQDAWSKLDRAEQLTSLLHCVPQVVASVNDCWQGNSRAAKQEQQYLTSEGIARRINQRQ
jgi:hypothetical protein